MEPDGRQVSVVDAKTAILDRTVALANALRKASPAEWATTPEHPWLRVVAGAGLSALSSLVSGRWTVPGAQGRTHPPPTYGRALTTLRAFPTKQTNTRS